MINIDYAIIEVTRRCNMACDHCLRGDVQNLDIPDSIIDTFFSKLGGGYISQLTITVGEPSLVPEKINAIIDASKRHGVSIGSFYMVTNAKKVTDDFLMAVMRLYCICSEKDMCGLQYSDDTYHDGATYENKEMLEVFRFASARGDSHLIPGKYEINEGRAKENGLGVRIEKGISLEYTDIDYYVDFEAEAIREMNVYLNCKGNIICGCDWSYKSQDKKANKMCSVDNFSLDAVYAYLQQFERKAKAA